jgi:hypothetical protein
MRHRRRLPARVFPDFFLTACQLSWYGVRFLGTIDDRLRLPDSRGSARSELRYWGLLLPPEDEQNPDVGSCAQRLESIKFQMLASK